MKKIAFYLDNTAVSNTDFSEPEDGNPGVGAAEYLHVVIPYFLNKIANGDYEFHIYAQYVDKMPSSLISHKVEDIIDAAKKAKMNKCDIFVFRPRIHEEKNILAVLDDIGLTSIGCAALTPDFRHIRKMSKCRMLKVLVCVGREQYDSLMDSPIYNKLALINNGISSKPFCNKIDLIKDPLLVSYMGSLVPQKGFHVLAKAWPLVLKRHPSAKLSVIGSAKVYNDSAEMGSLGIAHKDYENEFIAPYLVKEDGSLHPSITFHGKMGIEKYSLMKKSSVGIVNPTGQTETCCVCAVEFSAAGTAVVTGAYYALLDTVRHNDTGLLGKTVEDLADNICTLLDDNTRAIELGKKGKIFVKQNYEFEVVAPKWIELFLTLENNLKLSRPNNIKNIFSHRKWFRILNRPFQLYVGKFFFWPSTQEIEYILLKAITNIRTLSGKCDK